MNPHGQQVDTYESGGLNIAQFWCKLFQENERCWREGRFESIKDDAELTVTVLDAFPHRLYKKDTYRPVRYRLAYNRGELGQTEVPKYLAFCYARIPGAKRRVVFRTTNRGRKLECSEPKEKTMKVQSKKVSKKTDRGSTKAVDSKKAGTKGAMRAHLISVLKSNEAAKRTDEQIAKEMAKMYPKAESWTRENAALRVQAWRSAYNRGNLTGGEIPKRASTRWDKKGIASNPTRGRRKDGDPATRRVSKSKPRKKSRKTTTAA